MQDSPISRRPSVVTFDKDAFDEACATLMRLAVHEGCPDLLIGIKTGGLHVANSMAKAVGYSVPVLAITCRRPSSQYKSGLAGLKKLLTRLPRPVIDLLRVVEHKLLTGRAPSENIGDYQFDLAELAELERWLARSGPRPALLIVDDAIDTGTTLSLVLDAVRRRAPTEAKIASAVITVTTQRPRVLPDLTLYSGQLCRFPWSLDA